MDEVKVVLTGPGAERMSFTMAGGTTLKSGFTEVTLRCTVSWTYSLLLATG